MIYTTRRVFSFPSSSPLPCSPSFSISTDRQLKGKGSTQLPTHTRPQLRHVTGSGPSRDTAPLLPPCKHQGMVSLLVHGLSFAGHFFRAPWGQGAALAGYRGSTALAPFSALGSCLSIFPSIPMSLLHELCSLSLQAPMTSLPPCDPHSFPSYLSAPLISSCYQG